MSKTKKKIGRPVGAISAKRRMAMDVMAQLESELGRQLNPLEGLLRAGADENQPMSVRVQCWSEALPFLYPRLQTQSLAITGADGNGPVRVAHATLDVGKLLADPLMAQAYQNLALAVVEMDADADGAGNELPPAYSYELPPAKP